MRKLMIVLACFALTPLAEARDAKSDEKYDKILAKEQKMLPQQEKASDGTVVNITKIYREGGTLIFQFELGPFASIAIQNDPAWKESAKKQLQIFGCTSQIAKQSLVEEYVLRHVFVNEMTKQPIFQIEVSKC